MKDCKFSVLGLVVLVACSSEPASDVPANQNAGGASTAGGSMSTGGASDTPGNSSGGATLAASFIALDLIDEYEMFVCPVVLGGGTPYFPTGHHLELELVETRVFGGRVTYIRLRRPRPAE